MTQDQESPERARAYLLKQAKDQDVKFLRLWFTDTLGFLKSINITREGIEDALSEGVGFDGSSIKGLARRDESDLVAMPDPATFAVLPWRPDQNRVARVMCDIRTPDGAPYEGDPRWILRRQIERATSLGFTFYASAELEFFLFDGPDLPPTPLDGVGYFDQDPMDLTSDVRRDIILTLEEMGIAVDSSHHEAAPGQQEINLQYANGLAMADAIQTARFVVKQSARLNGHYATFMPRPLGGVNGSGLHLGLSLYRAEGNAFFDTEAPLCLSETGRAFVAGILRRARASTLVLNQWINSYRRLVPGTEAPIFLTWAQTNHADLVRVPAHQPGHTHSMRVEMRAADGACNAYLALAALLAAGLDGVEGAWSPPAPTECDVHALSPAERDERGIDRLPDDLGEAICLAERSDFLRGVLGPHSLDMLLANKRLEWADYRAHVSRWELDRYFKIL